MPKVGLGRGNVVNLFFFFAFSFFSKLFYIKKRGTTKAFVEVLSFLFLSFLLSLSLSLSLSKSWLLAIPFRSFLSLLHNGFEVVRFKTFFFFVYQSLFFYKKKSLCDLVTSHFISTKLCIFVLFFSISYLYDLCRSGFLVGGGGGI